MTFAIIIPTYNCEAYIGPTLESVLNQTKKPDEVIIVDDGSTDHTVSIAREMGFKVSQQHNAGPAMARNKAVSLANSDWIVFLDGDDLLEPGRVESLAKVVEENPNLSLIANNEFEGKPNGPWEEKLLHLNYKNDLPLYDQLLKGCFLSTSAMAIKRELYNEVGGMDENLRSAQDYDLWLRVAPRANFYFLEETLSRYIIRTESVTSNFSRRLKCMLTIFSKHSHAMGRFELFKRSMISHAELLIASLNAKSYRHLFKILSSVPLVAFRCLLTGKP